ncbi:UNVERIFIED_CONTAM: hypothetical protein Sindi_3122400 [Sesamum indicum]
MLYYASQKIEEASGKNCRRRQTPPARLLPTCAPQACRQQTGARVGSHCRRAGAAARLWPGTPACAARLVRKQPRLARARRCGNSPACARAALRKQPRRRERAGAETAPRARARLCGPPAPRAFADAAENLHVTAKSHD